MSTCASCKNTFCKDNHECGNACGTYYCSEACADHDWHVGNHYETCIGIELKDVTPAVLQILLNTEPWDLKRVCVANKKWNSICQSDVFRRKYVKQFSKYMWMTWFWVQVKAKEAKDLFNHFKLFIPWFRICVEENIFNPMTMTFTEEVQPIILIYAAGAGLIDLFKQLLWNRVDPMFRQSFYTLTMATLFGQLQILELLFLHPKVYFPVRSTEEVIAARKGYLPIIKFFASLNNRSVEFTRNDNQMIQTSVFNNQLAIVEYLLSLPASFGIDPTTNNQYCIARAASNGNVEMVKLLLRDPRVKPEADENYALVDAAFEGHTQVVEILLKDPRVLPSVPNNNAIRMAAANEHLDIVKLLLTRIEPSKGSKDALEAAVKKYEKKPTDRLKEVIEYLQFVLRREDEGERKKTRLIEAEQIGKKVSKAKAREILHHGNVHGKPLTEKQRRYFGWIANE